MKYTDYSLNTYRGHVIIKYTINNEEMLFLVDTGCPYTLLSKEARASSNLNIAEINLLEYHSDARPLNEIKKLLGINIDGVVGMNVLLKFKNVVISMKDEKIEFNVDDSQFKDKYTELSPKYGYSKSMAGKTPIIEVEFKGCGKKRTYFDTGAFLSYANFKHEFEKNGTAVDFHPSIGEFKVDTFSAKIRDLVSQEWTQLNIGKCNDAIKRQLQFAKCDAVIGTQCLVDCDFVMCPYSFQFVK